MWISLLITGLLLTAAPALADQLGYFHVFVEPINSFTDFCVDEKAVYLLEDFEGLTQIIVVDLVEGRLARWVINGSWIRCAARGPHLYLLNPSGRLAVYDVKSRSLIRSVSLPPYPKFVAISADKLIVGYPEIVEIYQVDTLELVYRMQIEPYDYLILQDGVLIDTPRDWILVGDEIVTINFSLVRCCPVKIGDVVYVLTPNGTLALYQGSRKIREVPLSEPWGVIETDGRYIYKIDKHQYLNIVVYDKDLNKINNFTLLETSTGMLGLHGRMKRARFYQSGNSTVIFTENWVKISIFKVDVKKIKPGRLTVCYITLLLRDAPASINHFVTSRHGPCLTIPRLIPGVYEVRAESLLWGLEYYWRGEVTPGSDTTVYIHHQNDIFLIFAIGLAVFVTVYRLVEKTWPQFS
jgi:hypothetical protein